MLLSGAGRVFMGLILFISGVQGRENSICALKGSSVDLSCSAQRPTSNMSWYTVHLDSDTYQYVLNEISTDGNRLKYNMSAESNFTMTIKDLTESDENNYCCRETTDEPENCWKNRIYLRVADLQVKVFPTTEGQTVTLICSTSRPLTENPEVYIWYKNREFLYQDWSPWYQELVSSEEAVTYSCAIEGYEDLRAPEVSVDSVSSTCFKVTYAKGRMCQQTSEDEPCSITYPTEMHVQWSSANLKDHVRLTCNYSCPLTDFILYKGKYSETQKDVIFPTTSANSFFCAIKGHEDLRSAEVCIDNSYCQSVNYVSRRICAPEGSSVNISSEYTENQQSTSKVWYKTKRGGKEKYEEQLRAEGRVKYDDNMRNHHILRINNLKKDDSAEYRFRLQGDVKGWKPGVTLVVTGLKVQFGPSAVVTEDQRVTLTCSTSCPLTDNTNYIWFFNSRPLTLTGNQNKHLVLDPVSSQHAGHYSCAVKTKNYNISSHEETLTVQSMRRKWTPAAVAGVSVCSLLLVIIALSVFCWIRKKRTSRQTEKSDNLKQLNPDPVYEDISSQPTEQDDPDYSRVHFPQKQSHAFYSTVQPHPPQEQDHGHYSVINL